MNSAHAFSYSIAGAYTDDQMRNHANYVGSIAASFKNAGGWLAQQAGKMVDSFNEFYDSRAWEMGRRLMDSGRGDYVSRYEIGYLGSLAGIQNAEGLMRNYIMAHPALQQAYLDGEISGYGGDFHSLCQGIGADNYFYRQAKNGLLMFEKEDDVLRLQHTHYRESISKGLSFRDRSSLDMTYYAIDHHRAQEGIFEILTDPKGIKSKPDEDTPVE